MKFTVINAIFTQTVAAYLAKGYTFNTQTMSGHQGEIAKVDLRNDNEVIRINLEHKTVHRFMMGFYGSCIVLTVGRCTDERAAQQMEHYDTTIWTERLEPIEERVFWEMNEYYRQPGWYVEGEEGIENLKRREGRSGNRQEIDLHPRKVYTDDATRKALIPAVRRHLNKPRMKADRIDTVTRTWNEDHYEYLVMTRGGNKVTLR